MYIGPWQEMKLAQLVAERARFSNDSYSTAYDHRTRSQYQNRYHSENKTSTADEGETSNLERRIFCEGRESQQNESHKTEDYGFFSSEVNSSVSIGLSELLESLSGSKSTTCRKKLTPNTKVNGPRYASRLKSSFSCCRDNGPIKEWPQTVVPTRKANLTYGQSECNSKAKAKCSSEATYLSKNNNREELANRLFTSSESSPSQSFTNDSFQNFSTFWNISDANMHSGQRERIDRKKKMGSNLRIHKESCTISGSYRRRTQNHHKKMIQKVNNMKDAYMKNNKKYVSHGNSIDFSDHDDKEGSEDKTTESHYQPVRDIHITKNDFEQVAPYFDTFERKDQHVEKSCLRSIRNSANSDCNRMETEKTADGKLFDRGDIDKCLGTKLTDHGGNRLHSYCSTYEIPSDLSDLNRISSAKSKRSTASSSLAIDDLIAWAGDLDLDSVGTELGINS